MQKIVIIQCAGSKTQDSWRCGNHHIIFVADSSEYKKIFPTSGLMPYQPDDPIPGSSMIWRQVFLDYYQNKKKPAVLRDSDELLEAWRLYKNPIYQIIVEKFEVNFFILSAGWGLGRADYRLPPYDITFSTASKALEYAKINSTKLLSKLAPLGYNPLCSVADENTTVYFFGGAKYRALLYHYTDHIPGTKVIYYRSKEDPRERSESQGYRFTRYTPKDQKLNTNWHYECARRFTNGELEP